MFNPKLHFVLHRTHRDQYGRFIITEISVNTVTLTLLCTYGPNLDDPAFYNGIAHDLHTFNCNAIIWAGDFNFVFNLSLDKQGGDARTNFKAREECLRAMFEYDLIDVWRDRNPFTKAFSWHSNIADIHCRLDFFLVTRSLVSKVKLCDFQPPIHSDHSLVILGLQLSEEPRGKGFWKFNNSLLADKNYVDSINELLDSEIVNTVHLNPSSRWEFIKYKIRDFTIGYSKRKAQSLRKRENDILLSISSLEKQLTDVRLSSLETNRKLFFLI